MAACGFALSRHSHPAMALRSRKRRDSCNMESYHTAWHDGHAGWEATRQEREPDSGNRIGTCVTQRGTQMYPPGWLVEIDIYLMV